MKRAARRPRGVLARAYLLVGLVAAAFSGLCLRLALRGPDDPNGIGLMVVLLVLLLLQTIPAAGLPGWLWSRVPSLLPERWPRAVWLTIGALAVSMVLVSLFIEVPSVVPVPVAASAFIGVRLAKLRRPWIYAWAVASVGVLALDGLALFIWYDTTRR